MAWRRKAVEGRRSSGARWRAGGEAEALDRGFVALEEFQEKPFSLRVIHSLSVY
jgi:hypothetical protein